MRDLPPEGLSETRFGLRFYVPGTHTLLEITDIHRKSGEVWGEMIVRCNMEGVRTQLDGDRMRQASFNFSSISTRNSWAKALDEMSPKEMRDQLAWGNVLERVSQAVLDHQQQGSIRGHVLTGRRMESGGRPWAAWPIIPHAETATIYARGGAGKTSLVDCVLFGMAAGRTIVPGIRVDRPYRPVILDWETNDDTAEDIWGLIAETNGVAVPKDAIWYEPMEIQLERALPKISSILDRHRGDLVVIDSVTMALLSSGEYSDPSESITRVYQALRRIGAWGLLIDHVAGGDLRSRRVAMKAYGCYSADTEVLTRRGWLTHDALADADQVLAFDPATETYRWEQPTARHAYAYEGPMHRLSTKATDALVTPNHRMLVHPAVAKTGWRFIEMDQLPRSDWLSPIAAPPPDEPDRSYFEEAGIRLPMDAWLRLVGWIVSEGSANRRGRIRIGQVLGAVETAITDTLAEIGWTYWRKVYDAPGRQPIAHIVLDRRADVVGWVCDNIGIGSANKRLPDFVWGLSIRQKHILLRALIDGDGSRHASGRDSYTTISPQLADDVQRLAILIGRHAVVRRRSAIYHGASRDFYQISISRPERTRTWWSHEAVTVEDYHGTVYCLTVPSGAYVTRRHGMMAVQGNSVFKMNLARHSVALHIGSHVGDTAQAYLVCPKSNVGKDHWAMAGTVLRSDDEMRWSFGDPDFDLYDRLMTSSDEDEADDEELSQRSTPKYTIVYLQTLLAAHPRGLTTGDVKDAVGAKSDTYARKVLNNLRHDGLVGAVNQPGIRENIWVLTQEGMNLATGRMDQV